MIRCRSLPSQDAARNDANFVKRCVYEITDRLGREP